jgi:hypothetical protein
MLSFKHWYSRNFICTLWQLQLHVQKLGQDDNNPIDKQPGNNDGTHKHQSG